MAVHVITPWDLSTLGNQHSIELWLLVQCYMLLICYLLLKNYGFEPNQSATEWNIGTALIVGNSIIAYLREAKVSRNSKVNVHFLLGSKTEAFLFHLIPFLKKEPNNASYSNENAIYIEMKKLKDLVRFHHAEDCS